MDAVWQWGVGLIVAIQTIRTPVLDEVFRAISFLGEETFYLLLFPALLWCADRRLGLRLGLVFLFSVYVNSVVKNIVGHPRPFDLEPSVRIGDAEGYGLPSGHAQAAVVIWGGIAEHVRRPLMWIAGVLLAGGIGFSRVYLGVHFPTDVLAGWGIGAALLALWLGAYSYAAAGIRRWSASRRIAFAVAAPAILAVLFPDKSAVSAMGTMAGLGVGYVVSARHLDVGVQGPWWQRVLRFAVGAVVLGALYLGLRMVFPGEGMALSLALRFVRYGILGLWVSLGAPWTFNVLRLAPRQPRKSVTVAMV